ncbi:Acetyltransferase (GNAT) family protein [Alteribacillus bidgolensis]|uniref:Acetyltransferase (GNAT) family protein n=1 Tax=Alteribacillus bidgolensis TaxID=930129 RepID=A0A1G8MEW7_9BACI|nr:Acetyltransferase (GNAT) family protein [Alteribacillus bidgolensis]
MLKKAVEYAEKTDAKTISLETGKENMTAQRLYEKIGFKRNTNYYYDYFFLRF